MGKHIQWYIVELERLLKGSVPQKRLSETLCEVEEHLKDDSAALTATCQQGQEPELLAIDRLGSPMKVAYQEISQRGRVRYWKAALLPMVFAVAMAVSYLLGAGGSHLANQCFWAATCGFVISSIFGRRRTPAALAYTVSGMMVCCLIIDTFLFAAHLPGTRCILRSEINAARSRSHADIDYINRNRQWFMQGKILFSQQAPPSGLSAYMSQGRYVIPVNLDFNSIRQTYDPSRGVFIEPQKLIRGKPVWTYTEPSWKQAKEQWKWFQYAGDRNISERTSGITWLDQMQKTTYWDSFRAMLPQILRPGIGFYAMLAVLNALCAGLSSLWRILVLLSRRSKAWA